MPVYMKCPQESPVDMTKKNKTQQKQHRSQCYLWTVSLWQFCTFSIFSFLEYCKHQSFRVFCVDLKLKYYYTFLPMQFKMSPYFLCIIDVCWPYFFSIWKRKKTKISKKFPISKVLMIVLATIIIISAPSTILPMDEMFV